MFALFGPPLSACVCVFVSYASVFVSFFDFRLIFLTAENLFITSTKIPTTDLSQLISS